MSRDVEPSALRQSAPLACRQLNPPGMSWEDAQKIAAEWLGSLHVGRDLYRKDIDLCAAVLNQTGEFRNMVLEAARRKLKKRGAREIILPPRAD